jgi:hypothetical protein
LTVLQEFEVGDRVSRRLNITGEELRLGVVSGKYKTAHPSIHGNDPWQYEIAWDDGEVRRGYLGTGLNKV